MKKITKLSILGCMFTLMLFANEKPLLVQNYLELITEEYLRNEFNFNELDTIKYAECKKLTHPTCKYIWGINSKHDAARAKYGLAPEGNKLMVIYAEAHKPEDFERSISVYSDAQKMDEIGMASVWSPSRKQLSFMTDKNLIVHINLETIKDGRAKEHALAVAKHLIGKLTTGENDEKENL